MQKHILIGFDQKQTKQKILCQNAIRQRKLRPLQPLQAPNLDLFELWDIDVDTANYIRGLGQNINFYLHTSVYESFVKAALLLSKLNFRLEFFLHPKLIKTLQRVGKKTCKPQNPNLRKVILNAFSFASSGNTLKISRCPWLEIASWFCCLSLKKCYRLVEVDKRFQDTYCGKICHRYLLQSYLKHI